MTATILRIPAAKTQSGFSRSTIYLRIAQGLWTKPVNLGPRAVGWPSNEIEALNAARISKPHLLFIGRANRVSALGISQHGGATPLGSGGKTSSTFIGRFLKTGV